MVWDEREIDELSRLELNRHRTLHDRAADIEGWLIKKSADVVVRPLTFPFLGERPCMVVNGAIHGEEASMYVYRKTDGQVNKRFGVVLVPADGKIGRPLGPGDRTYGLPAGAYEPPFQALRVSFDPAIPESAVMEGRTDDSWVRLHGLASREGDQASDAEYFLGTCLFYLVDDPVKDHVVTAVTDSVTVQDIVGKGPIS